MSEIRFELIPHVVREWEHAGLDCLVIRMADWPNVDRAKRATAGWHCGYVRLPDGCGLPDDYSRAPDDIECAAHGGLTFCGIPCSKSDGTWYGFDMCHCFDTEYDPEYAIAATERLADAIARHLGES